MLRGIDAATLGRVITMCRIRRVTWRCKARPVEAMAYE